MSATTITTNYYYKSCHGGALIVAVMAVFILSAIVGIAYSFTVNTSRMEFRNRNLNNALSVAEGSLELMFARFKTAAEGDEPTKEELVNAGVATAPTNAIFPDAANYQFEEYSISPIDRFYNGKDEIEDADRENAAVTGHPGWFGATSRYMAKSNVEGDLPGEKIQLGRIFQIQEAPIFQAAIFYEDDLEINPGAAQNINGLVHTNANLYTDSSNLIFEDYVSYVEEESDNKSPLDPHGTPGGAPTYANGEGAQLHNVGRLEPLGMNPDDLFDTTDTNPNNDGFRELIEPATSGHTDPESISKRRLYNQADVRIIVNRSGATATVTVQAGTGVSLSPTTISQIAAAVNTSGTLTDQRERQNGGSTRNGTVSLTTVDVGALNTAIATVNSNDPVVFIQDVSAGADGNSNKRGVKLTNGSTLQTDLTIASENPVYVHGNFNTGSSPDFTNADTTQRGITPGYDRKSAAIVGDAVMVLSNSWSDAASSGTSIPVASNTSVNAAFISGIVPSNGSHYSGGAENFPRLLENWGSRQLVYKGSMVQLFKSKQANAPWRQTGNYYQAPRRIWAFDPLFRTNPPPGFIRVTTIARGRWMRY